MDIKLKLEFDCTERLGQAISDAVAALSAIKSGVVLTQVPVQSGESTAEVTPEKPKRTRKKKEDATYEVPSEKETIRFTDNQDADMVDDLPFSSEEQPTEEPKKTSGEKLTEAPEMEVKEYTNQDLRDAMERIRKKHGDTEEAGNTELHNNLTACFKDLAKALGYPKPTALPTEGDIRNRFVESLEFIHVENNQATPF